MVMSLFTRLVTQVSKNVTNQIANYSNQCQMTIELCNPKVILAEYGELACYIFNKIPVGYQMEKLFVEFTEEFQDF